jgi:hypothetical protein
LMFLTASVGGCHLVSLGCSVISAKILLHSL